MKQALNNSPIRRVRRKWITTSNVRKYTSVDNIQNRVQTPMRFDWYLNKARRDSSLVSEKLFYYKIINLSE